MCGYKIDFSEDSTTRTTDLVTSKILCNNLNKKNTKHPIADDKNIYFNNPLLDINT